MTCDAQGNLILTGGFSNSITIDDTTITVSGTEAFVAKIDSAGTLQWITVTSGSGSAGAKDISIGDDGAIYITGDMSGTVCFGPHCTTQSSGVFVAKLLDQPPGLTSADAEIKAENGLSIYPNPGDGNFILRYTDENAASLKLEIHDSKGQLILSSAEKCNQGVLMKSIDLSKEPKGIYFLQITANGKKSGKKVVLN